jgi:hypothetical protein
MKTIEDELDIRMPDNLEDYERFLPPHVRRPIPKDPIAKRRPTPIIDSPPLKP